MKTQALKDFFSNIGYDWKKDEESMRTICHYTKTRVDKNKTETKLLYGIEQTFLVKAIAEWVNAGSFFEIGTGRGTACYAVSLVPSVKEIHTVDILDYNQKFNTAIGHKPVYVSLKDIKDMVPFPEKSKIHFHHRKKLEKLKTLHKNTIDVCFIDGEHDKKKVIVEDYAACTEVLKSGGLIVWDDYDPNQFKVKEVVEEVLASDSELDAILVEHRGHLFTEKPAEVGSGVLIMKKGKLL